MAAASLDATDFPAAPRPRAGRECAAEGGGGAAGPAPGQRAQGSRAPGQPGGTSVQCTWARLMQTGPARAASWLSSSIHTGMAHSERLERRQAQLSALRSEVKRLEYEKLAEQKELEKYLQK